MVKAAYIHIPFCKSICSYCDFCKMLYVNNWVNDYLKALYKEIKDNYNNEELSSIYIGGGTPSSLKPNQLEALFKIISLLKRSDDCEFTFECNITDITVSLLNILYKNGVNRLSIGIESFNKDKLEFMKRSANLNDAIEKIKLCRKFNFNNISVDLIYALPFENMKMLKEDLKGILKLNVDHISTYSLIVEDHTVVGINAAKAIPEDLEYEMYEYITDVLEVNKYHQYEISNFAKKGKKSRHNLTYWNNQEYYGFGLSASGFVDNVRYDNTRNLKKYIAGNTKESASFISKKDNMDNEIMLGLRKLEGINIENFNKKYDIDIYKEYNIKQLLKSRDLKEKKGYIFINPEKLYIMNEILIKLV